MVRARNTLVIVTSKEGELWVVEDALKEGFRLLETPKLAESGATATSYRGRMASKLEGSRRPSLKLFRGCGAAMEQRLP